MLVSEAYPSKFLKATDLQGREHRDTIANVNFENVGDDKKLVAYFEGRSKGLVLNKTNARAVSKVYGDDSRNWAGKEIILHETVVDFRGDSVPTIRVKFPTITSFARPPEPKPQSLQPAAAKAGFDDEIPF
jgi:hypothetical protein